MNGTLCVVGDKFSAFALGAGAITMSDLLKRVRNGHFQPDGEPIRLVAGRGLKQHEIDLLRRLIAMRGLRHHLIVDMDQDMHRAGRLEAHKHHPENVMVSLDLWGLTAPTVLMVFFTGVMPPNLMATGVALFPQMAGSASFLLGFSLMLCAAVVMMGVSYLKVASLMPLSGLFLVVAVVSRFLVMRTVR
ncbi:MAG TPA: hypothetical protein VD995_19060 [Azospirillum sp.]|nr:hypothetical protein [Azospirillum sp.]